MSRYAMLIDYEYCYGCHTCEVACQKEHGFGCDVWGIQVKEVGPYQYKDMGKCTYECIPVPTNLCDLCARRLAKGKEPACVHHCQSSCMKVAPLDELMEDLKAKPHQMLYVLS